jgi:hypothetical protein
VLADLATAGISGTLNIPVRVTTDLLVLIGLPSTSFVLSLFSFENQINSFLIGCAHGSMVPKLQFINNIGFSYS